MFYIKHAQIQLFSMEVDLGEIVRIMEVSGMIINAHTGFLLCTAEFGQKLMKQCIAVEWLHETKPMLSFFV